MNQTKHIQTFLDNQYCDFAVYRVTQRLPNLIDSLGQTQRKILYVMEQFPESKKLKTAQIYSSVYDKTSYLHGDASVYNVAENLARGCTNNLNLLTEEGSFGFRTNRLAASPRYTSTRFSKISRMIFRKEDWPILESQTFEGKEIESKFLLPIIPVGLVNGFLGIAVGFSSKFLPRDPEALIKESIRILRYKKRHGDINDIKINQIPLRFPFYNGNVIHNVEHENPSAWIMTGRLRKTKQRNVIEIYEVPPEYSRASYLKKLKSMLDKGIIKDFDEECRENKFLFRVKLPPEIGKLTEDELLVKLNLVDNFVENFTFIDPNMEATEATEAIQKFQTAEDYLRSFMDKRQDFYTIRRDYLIDKLSQEIDTLKERINFIRDVNNGRIIIVKRKKIDLEKELKRLGYVNIDDLLGMRMHVLTEESIIKFQKFIKDKEKELQLLIATTSEDMHINELKELQVAIVSEMKAKII